MNDPLGLWMTDNAELFRYAGEIPCMRDGASSIVLSGPASAFLAPLYRSLYPDAAITAVAEDKARLEEAKSEEPSLDIVVADPAGYIADKADIAVSVLYIQGLDTRELTPYLFSLHDSLADGGFLFLSFPSSSTISPYPKKLVDSWYSMDEKIYMKRYTPEDVVMALSIIGFDVRAIESDDNPDLGKVVSIHAQKRAVKPL